MRLPATTLSALSLMGLIACGDTSDEYSVEVLIPPSEMHGVHGLAFNAEGDLFGASLIGQSIYKIDIQNGDVDTVVGPTKGNADDVEFGPDGMMAWTGGL